MSKQILVVDDEVYIREVIQIALEMSGGWVVHTASSGQEAIELAIQHQPDAILLDSIMPDMDGLTTFKKLQENPSTQTIPVLLLTARCQDSDQQFYQQIGIQHMLPKPFDPLELANQISKALNWS
jgi:CheY-like chemotaxis protein